MRTASHSRFEQVLEKIRADMEVHYPDLRIVGEGDAIYVRGTFPVLHEGHVFDRYKIEIHGPFDDRDALPKVYETGGRIPKTLDRHVYPQTGQACLVVDEEWLVNVGRGWSFLEFLDGPVRNYFISQSLVEAGQPWPFEQRSHGVDGLVEAYGQWFDVDDLPNTLRYLDYLSREVIKGHWRCPCDGGAKLRNCHNEKVRELQKRIPPHLAKRALKRLLQAEDARVRYATSLRERQLPKKGRVLA